MGSIRQAIDFNTLQICLFSATIPYWVKQMANEFLKRNYILVDLAKDLKNKTAQTVNHLAINCPYHNRLAVLADLCKIKLFSKTKFSVRVCWR